MINPKIENIYVDKKLQSKEICKRYIAKFPKAKLIPITSEEKDEILEKVSISKNNIFITEAKGDIFKPCPGTDESHICCQYWVINQVWNCPLNCTYCILQYYLKSPMIITYINYEKIKAEITEKLNSEPNRFFRIGTGELGDSLVYDNLNRSAEEFIKYFVNKNNAIFELKTKSDNVDHLLNIKHNGKVVISWSLNPPEVIMKEEPLSAKLNKRLAGVKKVQDAGYKLGFHFDPIIYYDNWKEGYSYLIKELFKVAKPENITWISMGSLRYPPETKDKIIEKFPKTKIVYSEMFRGKDNKSRYFKPLRIEMYKYIYSLLCKYGSKDLFVYFCMEDKDVWQQVMGFAPENNAHLDFLFAEYLYNKFPQMNIPKPIFDNYQNFITE